MRKYVKDAETDDVYFTLVNENHDVSYYSAQKTFTLRKD